MVSRLHIPSGIHFECTGCGNCCLNWPVPLTSADVGRLKTLSNDSSSFKPLHSGDLRYRGFSHTLEKRSDGKCALLTEDNRCSLHSQYGESAKPAMCQLFPYAFTETPSGVFTYASFASTGVLYNSGRPLADQEPMLEEKFALYKQLFPEVKTDWSNAQLLDGYALPWDEYLSIESNLLRVLSNNNDTAAMDKLSECSDIAIAALPPSVSAEVTPPMPVSAEILDQLLLRHLSILYLPDNVFGESQFDLDARQLMSEIAGAPERVSLPNGFNTEDSFADLTGVTMDASSFKPTETAAFVEELLQRFIYARVFAKLYFGAGYAHLSLISGIHHLFFLVALVRLRVKQIIISRPEQKITFEDVAEILRTVERRLTQLNLSKQSCMMLEVLLSSPARLIRVKQLAQ